MKWWEPPLVAAFMTLVYVVARRLYDDVYQRVRVWQGDRVELRKKNLRADMEALLQIPADERGRLGAMMRADGSVLNLDTRGLLDERWRVRFVDPMMEKMNHLEKLMLHSPRQPGSAAQGLLPEPGPVLPNLITPDHVMDGAPSYRRLVLGRTEHSTITADMADLVHVAVGGSSGWGKSVFLRWMVYQLIKSTDPVQLALIDLEGITLAPFANSNRVLWPLADTEQDAAIVMKELVSELDRRKELYGKQTGVDSLYAYNEATEGQPPLLPIVVAIDEATALLENKIVEGSLRTLATRARKYGLWLIMAGQDWKGTSLDTAIRNQIGARVQFRAMSSSQSRVLLGVSGAEQLEVKGRAMISRPGKTMTVFQTPMIKYSDIRGLRAGGPVHPMPAREEKPQEWKPERLRKLWDSLPSKGKKSAMCVALGGKPEGHHWGRVEEACKAAGLPWEKER